MDVLSSDLFISSSVVVSPGAGAGAGAGWSLEPGAGAGAGPCEPFISSHTCAHRQLFFYKIDTVNLTEENL